MGQKKLLRKAEPPSKRGIAWPRWTGFRNKTVWDFLQLLIVPLMLAALGFWFTAQQDARQQQIENQRAQQAQKIENQRAEAEQELAEQRAQDEALQAYLDQMSQLMLERKLLEAEKGDPVHTLAQARTSTIILRLDAKHNKSVTRFLSDSGLSGSGEASPRLLSEIALENATLSDALLHKTDLSDADLSGALLSNASLGNANLSNAQLANTNLSNALLSNADLSNAFLEEADLSRATLVGTDLSNAILIDANLSDAFLPNADFRDAFVSDADLIEAILRQADLSDADLIEAILRQADLSDADLSDAFLSNANITGASLTGANLTGADLSGANLTSANLSGAVLTGADLSNAILQDASGVTKEMLKQQAKSLHAATMPDGTVLSDRYATSEFEPALSFSLSEEWGIAAEERPDRLSMIYHTEVIDVDLRPDYINFTNPLHVFDPGNLRQPKKLPGPENAEEWVSWFQRHPNLDTSKPVPASVGDASGKRIDVTVTSTPQNYPEDVCGTIPCVPLYPLSNHDHGIMGHEGYKDRFVIVDVGNETVVIDVAPGQNKFDEFLPKAQKVLDTVEWSESE